MRIQGGKATRRRRKKWIKLNEGAFGTRHVSYRTAKQSVIKNAKYAYRDRKNKKRDFRKLWILRLNAALRQNGTTYSKFMNILRKKNIETNRKILSELAIQQPEQFKKFVESICNE